MLVIIDVSKIDEYLATFEKEPSADDLGSIGIKLRATAEVAVEVEDPPAGFTDIVFHFPKNMTEDQISRANAMFRILATAAKLRSIADMDKVFGAVADKVEARK